MYVGTAYIIIEVVNNLVEPLHLPSWIATLVVLLLFIGLPIVAVVSWIFDITPEGVKKTGAIKEPEEKEILSAPVKRQLKVSDFVIAALVVIVAILAVPKILIGILSED